MSGVVYLYVLEGFQFSVDHAGFELRGKPTWGIPDAKHPDFRVNAQSLFDVAAPPAAASVKSTFWEILEKVTSVFRIYFPFLS